MISDVSDDIVYLVEKSLGDLNINTEKLVFSSVPLDRFLGVYVNGNPNERATHVDTPLGNTIDFSEKLDWCLIKRYRGVHFGNCADIKNAVKRQEWVLKTFFEDFFKNMCLGLVVDEAHKKDLGFLVEELELVSAYSIYKWLVVCENSREVVLCLPISVKYTRGNK